MSEPKGADVFGYTHKPYKGYSISASKGFTKQDGKQENHAKEDKEQQVKWDGGVLAIKRVVKHYHSGIPILFSPENKQLPTILLNEWGRIFYSLRDDLVEYAPEKPEKQGWTQLQSFFTYINLLNEFQNSK